MQTSILFKEYPQETKKRFDSQPARAEIADHPFSIADSGEIHSQVTVPQQTQKPNIILIYGDDVGYGDLGCYGATGVKTPHVDQLAAGGMRFTSGYAAAATCTPSRFSILTGEYAFRQKGAKILAGDAKLIIQPGRETVPAMLRRAGYATAAVGKWHLGLGVPEKDIDWNGVIKPGPLEIGFDYSFIIPATPDRVPCVYVQNHHVLNLDTNDAIRISYQQPFPGEITGKADRSALVMNWSHQHNEAVINGIGRIGYMVGGKSALWKDDEIEQVLSRQAVDFIEREKNHPFFLYYASRDVHVPRVPNAQFVGKTTMGPRGDEIAEFDWSVGQIVSTLQRLHLLDHTLIVLTSDNGPVLDDGYQDQANEKLGNHQPGGVLRAGKYSRFDGGTRVPFISYWAGKIKPGVSDAMIDQVDLLASFATLTGQSFNTNEAVDSENLLPVLLGKSDVGRQDLVEDGWGLAIRHGQWKFIPPGHTRDQLGPWNWVTIPEPGFLFDLSKDPGETNNLSAQCPEKIKELADRLAEIQGHPENPEFKPETDSP